MEWWGTRRYREGGEDRGGPSRDGEPPTRTHRHELVCGEGPARSVLRVGARTQESGPPAPSSPRNPGIQSQPLTHNLDPSPPPSKPGIQTPGLLRPRGHEPSLPPSDSEVQTSFIFQTQESSPPSLSRSEDLWQSLALLPSQTQGSIFPLTSTLATWGSTTSISLRGGIPGEETWPLECRKKGDLFVLVICPPHETPQGFRPQACA